MQRIRYRRRLRKLACHTAVSRARTEDLFVGFVSVLCPAEEA